MILTSAFTNVAAVPVAEMTLRRTAVITIRRVNYPAYHYWSIMFVIRNNLNDVPIISIDREVSKSFSSTKILIGNDETLTSNSSTNLAIQIKEQSRDVRIIYSKTNGDNRIAYDLNGIYTSINANQVTGGGTNVDITYSPKKICFLLLVLMIAGCVEEKAELKSSREKEKVEQLAFYTAVEVVDKNQPPYIVVSKDKLDFGKLPRGMSERKEVLLENNKDRAVKVRSVVNGSIAEWISFEKDEILIPPKSGVKLSVYLKVPDDAKIGNYTGYITFIIVEGEV